MYTVLSSKRVNRLALVKTKLLTKMSHQITKVQRTQLLYLVRICRARQQETHSVRYLGSCSEIISRFSSRTRHLDMIATRGDRGAAHTRTPIEAQPSIDTYARTVKTITKCQLPSRHQSPNSLATSSSKTWPCTQHDSRLVTPRSMKI